METSMYTISNNSYLDILAMGESWWWYYGRWVCNYMTISFCILRNQQITLLFHYVKSLKLPTFI